MKELHSLSLFMPRDNFFYQSLLGSMRDAFHDFGIKVSGRCGLLDEQEMDAWIKEYRPDAIFEMNRVAGEIPWFPKSVKHISWVVDFGGRDQSQIMGSDITYFFCPGWNVNYNTEGFSDWLPPGTNTKQYAPAFIKPEHDFVFVGHIPAPWSDEELDYVLGHYNGKKYKFSDLLKEYISESKKIFSNKATHKDLKELCYAIMRKRTNLKNLPQKIEYDLLERTKRMDSRCMLIDSALMFGSKNIQIYGSETWRLWKKYRPFYKRFISDSSKLNRCYCSAKFCLHDGVGIHFRSMDCMASGGLLLYSNVKNYEKREDVEMDAAYGLHTYFDEGVHFLQFSSIEELSEIYKHIPQDERMMNRIRVSAADTVRRNHTWHHRAQKIIDDCARYL